MIIKQSKKLVAGVTLTLIVFGFSSNSFGQTVGTNYLRTRIPQIAVTDTSKLDTIPVQRQEVIIQYSDGLGRGLQSVQVQASPLLNDLIVPFAYDNMGRPAKSYMPYADTSAAFSHGGYRSNAFTSAVSFYNPTSPWAPKIPTDTSPFAQTVYETSPLQRVNEQGETGAISQPGTGHTITASYQANALTDGVSYYYNIVEGTSVSYSQFPQGTLGKTVVADENGHRMALWKDLQGRTVTRTQLDAPSAYYSNDYVYNDLGQLSDIITPAQKKEKSTSPSSFQTGFGSQAYIQHYDSVGRLVERKVPGKGWIYMVYNRSNRPVLMQDSNMHAKNQWTYMKYDAEGRIVQTGIYSNTVITTRKALQLYCDANSASYWESWQPGIGYTDNAFPMQSETPSDSPLILYTTFYYDDYSFSEASAKPFQSNVYGNSPTQRTMGMLTGVSMYVLGTASQRLITVNYYDKFNRLIQQLSDNHLGQVDIVNNQYNFFNQLTGTQRSIAPFSSAPYVIQDKFVYDQVDRLVDTYEKFRDSTYIDISHNNYNEIGQKVSEGLNSYGSGGLPSSAKNIVESATINNTRNDIASQSVVLLPGFKFTAAPNKSYHAAIGFGFSQVEEFRYNIKGQLTNINNGTLTYDHGITQSDSTALFGESINYWDSSPLSGSTAQYNGNISSVTWRNKIENTPVPSPTVGGQGYALTYDNINRLNAANYYVQSGGGFSPSTSLSETIGNYDEMGNIGSLVRKDKAGANVNNLTYTYPSQSNQLSSINDSGSQNISGTFAYDGNGNLVSDSFKGLTITYNYLDLPDTVKQGSNRLVFTYDAAGNKLYKQLIVGGSVVSQRHYIDDAEVVATSSIALDGKVESIAMGEGRIVNTGSNFQYEYYLQDHLYNNRVSFRANGDGSLKVTRVQNYYPFGADMGDATMNYADIPTDNYKYANKELQPELNLNTYDFGARHYDRVLARWLGLDALAETSDEQSPYNYVANNPMNLMDPDGMQYTSGLYGYPKNVSSGSGGLFGSAGPAPAIAGGAYQFLTGLSAFRLNGPDFSTLNSLNAQLPKVQGNSNKALVPPPIVSPGISGSLVTETGEIIWEGTVKVAGVTEFAAWLALEVFTSPNDVKSPQTIYKERTPPKGDLGVSEAFDVEMHRQGYFSGTPPKDNEERKEYYIHYSNRQGITGIAATQAIFPNKKNKVYLTKSFLTEKEVENILFIGQKPGYGKYMTLFKVDPDQQANITKTPGNAIEYQYNAGTLRIRSGNLIYIGPNPRK